MDQAKPIRSFGRVQARALKPTQEAALRDLAPLYAPPEEGPLAREALFPGAGRFALEIGFGGGEHLAAQASADPALGMLGVEPFVNGVAKALLAVEGAGLSSRVRIFRGDAREVLPRIPDGALDRVWILFPDPWPKARHWKRRLIQPEVVSEIARVLAPGGELRFATDWKAYAAWSLELFLREPRLAWMAERADDWREPWPGHVTTRYEAKRLGDTPPIFLRFARV